MTVQLLAQNILTDAHFLSATSQASPFWGQPLPAAANTGKFRLLNQETPADFSYAGTTTADGATPVFTTLINSALAVYGDDYFIGGTIAITSGAANGETRTVSDFAQATGTITVSVAFSARIVTGVTFTLTVSYATRAFQAVLIVGGDAGDATFKWTHDPTGPTWLGRDDPNAATWLGSTLVHNSTAASPAICQAADKTLIVAYNESTDVFCKRSIDNGITWGAAITISTRDLTPYCLLALRSGRILAFLDKSISYSDDYGLTWSATAAGDFDSAATVINDCIEMASGVLMAVYRDSSNNVCQSLSPDGGFSWTDGTTITASCGANTSAAVIQAENGNIVCAYAKTGYDIKCKISENGGYTWGSEISVLNEAESLYRPNMVKGIDGRLFMGCYQDTADQKVVFSTSSDNGATWGAVTALATPGAGVDFKWPDFCLADGYQILCVFLDATNSDVYLVRRGIWTAFSANACPAGIEAKAMSLICGAELIWHGSGGVAADAWTFGPEYDFSMENLIADSPSKPWRTAADNADYAVVLDLGANARFYADGVAFFGCNVREIIFEMDDNNADWTTPLVHQHVDFTIVSGVVDAVNGNALQDTSLLANYADHELKGRYLRILVGGAAAGNTWKILDNVSTWIMLDTTAATAIAGADTFAIFGTKAAKSFTAGLYRYVRILVEAQQTAENYYQIGYAALGRMVSLASGYATGYSRTRQANVDMLRTLAGGMIPMASADPKNVFELTWPLAGSGAAESWNLTRDQLLAMLDMQRGQNIVLIPDSADLLDIHLVKAVSDARQTHRFRDEYDVTLTLEEVL